jgi:hypothetical protein
MSAGVSYRCGISQQDALPRMMMGHFRSRCRSTCQHQGRPSSAHQGWVPSAPRIALSLRLSVRHPRRIDSTESTGSHTMQNCRGRRHGRAGLCCWSAERKQRSAEHMQLMPAHLSPPSASSGVRMDGTPPCRGCDMCATGGRHLPGGTWEVCVCVFYHQGPKAPKDRLRKH